MSIIGLLVLLVVLVLGIGGTIFWVWMLIDCATKEPSEDNDKIQYRLTAAIFK